MRRVNGQKIRKLIRYRSNGTEGSLELMVKDELSPTDAKFLVDLSKGIEDHLSQKKSTFATVLS